MRILIIDEATKVQISSVVEHAETHRVSLADLKATMEGKRGPIGDTLGFTCCLPHGFRVTYSIEEQPCGLCQHLSVSVSSTMELP